MAKIHINERTAQEIADDTDPNAKELETQEETNEGNVGLTIETEEEVVRPEKFKTEADLIKAYKELENQLGKKKPEDEKEEKPETKVGEVNFDKYATEFATSGELTPESYMELAALGYSKDIVDTYVEGKKLQQDTVTNQIMDVAGGKDQYAQAIQWAKDNWTKEQVTTFNDIMNANNVGMAEFAVRALVTEFSQKGSFKPNLIKGTSNSSSNTLGVYESRAQMVKDMQSRAYKTDPAFRDAVAKKIRRSAL